MSLQYPTTVTTNNTAIDTSQNTQTIGGYTSGYTPGHTPHGYTCGNCGQYVVSAAHHHCLYYAPPYPNYYPNYIPPQIIIWPQPVVVDQPDHILHQQVQSIDDRLESLEEKVEKLLDLLLNKQDEEVRGHPQGERPSADSEGGTEAPVELSLTVGGRRPKGNWSWPRN